MFAQTLHETRGNKTQTCAVKKTELKKEKNVTKGSGASSLFVKYQKEKSAINTYYFNKLPNNSLNSGQVSRTSSLFDKEKKSYFCPILRNNNHKLLEGKYSLFYLQIYKVKQKTLSFFKKGNINLHYTREKISEMVVKNLSKEHSSYINKLMLGIRDDYYVHLDPYIVKSGVSHLFAISGFHLSFIFFASRGLLKRVLHLSLSEYFAYFFVILFLILSGSSVSAVRAAVMLSVALFASSIARQYSSLRALIFTALILGLADITTFFTISFQLSFLATLTIILVIPYMRKDEESLLSLFELQNETVLLTGTNKKFDLLKNYFFDSLLISLVISVVLAPLLIFYFGTFEMSQLFSSTFVGLLMYPIIFLSLMLFIIKIFGLVLFESVISTFLSLFLDFLQMLISLFSSFSYSISLVDISVTEVLAWWTACLIFFLFIKKNKRVV